MRLTENLTTLTWQIHNDSGVNVLFWNVMVQITRGKVILSALNTPHDRHQTVHLRNPSTQNTDLLYLTGTDLALPPTPYKSEFRSLPLLPAGSYSAMHGISKADIIRCISASAHRKVHWNDRNHIAGREALQIILISALWKGTHGK